MEKPSVVFMGTPEFAVPSLQILIENNYPVKAVITVPDKPSGRGQKVSESPVKQLARQYGLMVLQPDRLKDAGFISTLKKLNADIQIVVAFRMLPEVVWSMPPMGTFNLHASLLPQYRGAAPINHAIINGETKTGLTTFFLKHDIDTGNIIFQQEADIYPDDTAGTLHDRLMTSGAGLVLKSLQAIESGQVKTINQADLIQPGQRLIPAPKIFKTDCRINFNQPADQVRNFIRGLSPYPGAFFEIASTFPDTITIKVFDAKVSREYSGEPGHFFVENSREIRISCLQSSLYITEIQMSGKKRMSTSDFLMGHSFSSAWKIISD